VIVIFAGNLHGTLINYIVINIFLLISMENNRAIYHCIAKITITKFTYFFLHLTSHYNYTNKNRESIRDGTAELQVIITFSEKY
jgi:hypothetical protein